MVRKFNKIPKKEQEELLTEFCEAFLSVRNIEEVAKFLTDLLTEKEILILTKRIKIAKYLLVGKKYREIEEVLKVSHATISKIAEWLVDGGEGFKMIADRTKKRTKKKTHYLGVKEQIKKVYPSYFWPEILVEDLMKNSDKRQKEKIKKAIDGLNKKTILYKKLKSK